MNTIVQNLVAPSLCATGKEKIMALHTPTSPKGFAPDLTSYPPEELVAGALILSHSTVLDTTLEGDAPVVHVPWISDDQADFVAEGTQIPEPDPELADTTIRTAKISRLVRVSREQMSQPGVTVPLSKAVERSVQTKADQAFINNPAPTGDYITPTGIAHLAATNSASIAANNSFDIITDLVGLIESAGGHDLSIIAHPVAWTLLRKIKLTTGEPLLGAGTQDIERRILGIPATVSNACATGQLLILDKTAVVSSVGKIQIALNEATYFASDEIALRATWRIGWSVTRPERIAAITITATGE